MDMAAKYNKSEVMRKAWYIYRHSFMSFSEALKESWKRIKDDVASKERLAAHSAGNAKKNGAYNYRLERAYYGCDFGRNDWNRDYRNDVKAAVRRSVELNRNY